MSESTQNWRQLSIIQIGGAICLPVMMVGQILAQMYGLSSAIIAILLGNFLLFAMACVTSYAGAKEKKSTAEFAVSLFGRKGKLFFSGAMVLSVIGWFAIQLQLMGFCFSSVISHIFYHDLSYEAALTPNCTVILGILMAFAGLRGLKGMTFLANFVTPILAVTIIYAITITEPIAASQWKTSLITFSGLSLVIATSVASVIDLPNFFRLAKSPKDALIAAFLIFVIATPLIEASGAFLFSGKENSLVDILQMLSPTILWKTWIPAALVLGGWATNNANMYSASVSFLQFFPRASERLRLTLVCLAGTLVACLPVVANLESVLNGIGIILCSMGAVLIGHLITLRAGRTTSTKEHIFNLVVWAGGVCMGTLSALEFASITGISVLDAFTFSLSVQLICMLVYKLYKLRKNRKLYKTDLSF